MKSVEEFLKKIKEAQAFASFQHELSSTDLTEIELDSMLLPPFSGGGISHPFRQAASVSCTVRLQGEEQLFKGSDFAQTDIAVAVY
jgi:hypothetical protein